MPCAKYWMCAGDNNIWSGYYGSNGFGLCYYQRVSEDLQIGAEIENSMQHQQTIASVGYQFDIPKANFVMKGNWLTFRVM